MQIKAERKIDEIVMDLLAKIKSLCPWVLLVCLGVYHLTFVHMVRDDLGIGSKLDAVLNYS